MTEKSEWDWLIFAAHPDDAEIGAGGLMAYQALMGKNIVICDLTAGEMSSNGDPATRRRESLKAAEFLGVKERICLNFPDRGLEKSEDQVVQVVKLIRQYRPRFVLSPWHGDSHPDHRQASALVREGIFNARLRRYGEGDPWIVKRIWEYFVNETADHPVYLKLSQAAIERKYKALGCYQSQFIQDGKAVPTRLHGLLRHIEYRDGYAGGLVGAEWAEAFFQMEEISVRNLQDLD